MATMRLDPRSKGVFIRMTQLNKYNKIALTEAFTDIGAELVRRTKNRIVGEVKTGRKYRRLVDGTWQTRQASSPGQTPALIQGDYYRGLGFTPRGHFGLTFDNTSRHSEFLENGTRKMKKRPGMKNAILFSLSKNKGFLNNSLRKAFNP